ncbi:MAG: DNA-directed RNA polymerase subunit N [Candidatus Bathyarchaeia archaeon]
MIPIRCFTCGSLIADKWEDFSKRVKRGEPPKEVLDDMGVKRYCCRRMLLTHVSVIDRIIRYHTPRQTEPSA